MLSKKKVKFHTPRKAMRILLQMFIKEESIALDEVSIVLLNDNELLQINRKVLNHNFYTDIISFDNRNTYYGQIELCISIDRVRDNAQKNKCPVTLEFLRVFIHGMLHIAGYRDKKKKDILEMRKRENYYLNFVSRETRKAIC